MLPELMSIDKCMWLMFSLFFLNLHLILYFDSLH